jgi:hypothetical protein
MSISIVALISAAILVISVAVLSVSRSDTLDTVLYIALYSAAVVSITTSVVGFISGLS